MRLTKVAQYSIQVLVECARANGRLLKARDLGIRLGLTNDTTRKIVYELSQLNLVETERGQRGGVRLANCAYKLTIGDVLRAIDRPCLEVDPGRFRLGKAAARSTNEVFELASKAFLRELDRYTFSDIAAPAPMQTSSKTPQPPLTSKSRLGRVTNAMRAVSPERVRQWT